MPEPTGYFNVERVPAVKLDALLEATERDGHRLIHLRVERRAGTSGAYVYTLFFKTASKATARARTKNNAKKTKP